MKKMSFGISFALMLFSMSVVAGGWSGSGGNTVVCDNPDGTKSYEVLDLFEGRVRFGFKYNQAYKKIDFLNLAIQVANQVHENCKSVSCSGFLTLPEYQTKKIFTAFKTIPENTELNPVLDYNGPLLPKNCNVKQTINYYTDSEVLVDGAIWSQLDDFNKAALLAHEVMYRDSRSSFGISNSDRIRHMVAAALSDELKPVTILPYEKAHRSGMCTSLVTNAMNPDALKDLEFWGAINANGVPELEFTHINGEPVLQRAILLGTYNHLPHEPGLSTAGWEGSGQLKSSLYSEYSVNIYKSAQDGQTKANIFRGGIVIKSGIVLKCYTPQN